MSQSTGTTSDSDCKPGKRWKCRQSADARNTNKRLRYAGLPCGTVSKKPIEGKSYIHVDKCCTNRCYEFFNESDGQTMFNSFYNGDSKEVQDMFLASCMTRKPPQTVKTDATRNNVESLWDYSVKFQGVDISVCQKYLMRLYQIKRSRIRIIQRKVRQDESDFKERRGRHKNRPKKIKHAVWKLVREHLGKIPAKRWHYGGNKSRKLYFEDETLTWRKLYDLFTDYYRELNVDGSSNTNVPAFKTYCKYIKRRLNYGLRSARTDVCDFCSQCTATLAAIPDHPIKTKFNIHKVKYEEHKKIKNRIIAECEKDGSNVIAVDFDYSRNYLLPRISENSKFYKNLLSMYVFNIHLHGKKEDSESVLYHFLETDAKKNANTVISFLYDFLSSKLERQPDIRTIHLFSDVASSQNKNNAVVSFCSWFSWKNHVQIFHWFPESGHSFCQCDRNFSVCRLALKKCEKLLNAEDYVRVLKTARRHPPFIVKEAKPLLKEWNFVRTKPISEISNVKNSKNKKMERPQRFEIQSYVRLCYLPNGTVLAGFNYSGDDIRFDNKSNCKEIDVEQLPAAACVPLKPRKEKDIKSLFPFFSPEIQRWYSTIFENSNYSYVGCENKNEEEDDRVFSESASEGEFFPEQLIEEYTDIDFDSDDETDGGYFIQCDVDLSN